MNYEQWKQKSTLTTLGSTRKHIIQPSNHSMNYEQWKQKAL